MAKTKRRALKRKVMKGCFKRTKNHKKWSGGCGSCVGGGKSQMGGRGHTRSCKCDMCRSGHSSQCRCNTCRQSGGSNALGLFDPLNNSNSLAQLTNGVTTIPQPYSPWW